MAGFIGKSVQLKRVQRVTVFSWLFLMAFASTLGLAEAGDVLARAALSTSPQQACLIINDSCLWDIGLGHNLLWASVSVKDSSGNWVTGLPFEAFHLTEALISPTGEVVQEWAITLDKPDYQFHGDGFWERSVTAEKVDIVLVIDGASSLANDMPGVRSELHEFVSRLLSSHVDFRLGVIMYGESVEFGEGGYILPFHGIMEAEEIDPWIDDSVETFQEWWQPSVTYDALMFATDATEFDFRQDARKVIVVISDAIPQTVYGGWWHPQHSTAATLSAVEVLFKESYPDIEILYCQPEKLRELQNYSEDKINPRAMQSGFDKLKELGVAKDIPWPFQQESISITGGGISDSRYYLAWVSMLDLPGDLENHKVRVTVQVAEPEQPGQFLQEVFYYTPVHYLEDAPVVISVRDEEGNPIDDLEVYLYAEMGDRKEVRYWQMAPTGGQIVQDVDVGKYYLLARDGGWHWYSEHDLRYIHRERGEVKSGSTLFQLRIQTADKEIEFAKARGLLKDLKGWGITERPFRDFVAEAETWLDSVEANGVTWNEMIAVKRFYVALSGYANASAYAQVEARQAVEDFKTIVRAFRNIMKAVQDTDDYVQSEWNRAISIILDIVWLIIDPSGQTLAQRNLCELLLEELADYAKEELVPDVLDAIKDLFPPGTVKDILSLLIENLVAAKWDDWTGVLQTAASLGLDVAIDQVAEEIADEISDELFMGIVGPENIKSLVKEVVMAIANCISQGKDFTFDDPGFKASLDKVKTELPSLAGEALNGIRNKIIEKLAGVVVDELFSGITGSEEVKAVVKEVFVAFANYDWVSGDFTFNTPDINAVLDGVRAKLQSFQEEALETMINTIVGKLTDELANQLFSDLSVRQQVVSLAKEVFVAFTHFDWRSKDFTFDSAEIKAALDEVKAELPSLLQDYFWGDKNMLLFAFDEVYKEVQAKLEPGPVKDVVVPVVDLFVRWTVEGKTIWDIGGNLVEQAKVDQLFDLGKEQIVLLSFDEVFNQIEERVGEGPVRDFVAPLLRLFIPPIIEGKATDQEAVSQLFGFGSKEDVIKVFDEIFDQIEDKLDAGPVRDFLLPLVRLLVRTVIEEKEINEDVVIEVLVHLCSDQLILKPQFSNDVNGFLGDALGRAKAFIPEGQSRSDWEHDMDWAFWDFRGDIMDPLQTKSWDALSEQSPIDDLANVLDTLFDVLLKPLEALFYVLCAKGYPTCVAGEYLSELDSVLNALELLTSAYELFIRADDMATMKGQVQYINPRVLPKYLRVTNLLRPGGTGFLITWNSQNGLKYRVQYKNDLFDPQWTDLSGDIVAAGTTASWTDSRALAATRRFYRVIRIE